MRTPFIRRFVSSLLIIAALIGASLQPIAVGSVLSQSSSDPGTPDRVADPIVSTSGPVADPALDQPPAPDQAVVTDQQNSDWQTVYGTEAGRQLLPPRRSEVPAAIEGAVPPLNGFWSTQTIQAGAQGVTAVAYAPDGRLFAGLSGLGLRVYGPNVSNLYQWTSITASPGGLVSNNVTALAVFGSQLWIGTGGSGVSVYNLTTGTWISYTVANSPLPSDYINRITPVIDPNGPDYVWISTSGGGAAKFTPGRPNVWNIINSADSALIGNTMYDVAVDINGTTTTTWFASGNGLTSWNGTTFTAQGGGNCTPWNYARRVIVDHRHRVWYVPVQIIPGKPQGPDQPATTVDEPIGVCLRTVSAPLPLVFYTLYNTTSPGLPSNDVSDLSEDFAGRIWMSMQGTGGGAVNDNGTWKLYTSPTSPLINNDVRTVLAVGEAVWWGHGGANAFTIHSPNWLRFSNIPSGETPQSIFNEATRTWMGGTSKIAYTDGGVFTTTVIPGNTNYVTSFARDANNHLWIGTSGGGVYDYNGATFTPYTTTSGLPNNGVNALLSDQLGRIWAGTNNGLAMRAEAGYWLTFTTSTSPIAGNFIEALARDSADRLWIGTASGLSVYNPAGGNNAWITYTVANGLPVNQITGLTGDAAGNMWVSTFGGGIAVSNSISSTWTVYSSTAYLPSTQAMRITADPSGRIWTTTSGGLVLRQGSTWRTFHVPETSLDSHRLVDVVADADRTWVKGNATISVRGVITSPIGNSVPAITSFSPISATPGATIIINGNYFDDRGPEFNVVKFPSGSNHITSLAAEVISVTTTSIAVKVPALADSGKLQVTANGLSSPLSTATFQLQPKITSLNATCLSAGSELKISGLGFLDGSAAAYVKIGSGAERIADATDPTQVRAFIRPGDASGQVHVRILNNNQAIASQSLSIATVTVNQTKVQQAIEGEQLVWGKNTLVQLAASSGGCGGAKITRASLKWKFAGGFTIDGGTVNYPNGKTLPSYTPDFSLDNAVSLNAPLDIDWVAYQLDQLGLPYFSTLQYFDSVDVVLRNNNVDVLTINLPKTKFNFVDTSAMRRHIITMMVTGNTAPEQDPNYDQTMYTNFAAVARLYPQQDGWATGGRYSWLHTTPIWFSYPNKIYIGDGGNYDDARDEVDDYLDPGGNTWAVAYLDQMNIASGSGGGIGSSHWHTVVAINQTDLGGRYIAHEVMHAFGFVDSDAPNYQPASGGADHHSKYNEGQWSNFSDCVSSRTFRQALDDATGNPNRRVVRLISGDVPKQLFTAACTTQAGNVQSNTAKSVISYAPNRDNFNTVMEPYDYRNLLDQLCGDGGCYGYAGQMALQAPIGLRAPQVTNDVTRTLHLNGEIDVTGTVTPSLSYVAVNDGAVTPQDPAGTHHLIVLAADNSVLHDQTFSLENEALTPHETAPATVLPHDGTQPQHDEPVSAVSLFNLRVPFPDNAVKAEIVYSNTVLWSKTVSPNAPTVSINTPNGGTFNAGTPISVTWTANDVDGDPLQFALDYSADNGATWMKLNPKMLGTGYWWTPGYVTATNTARLRLRASDGFNTAFATSNSFVLTAKAPEALILAPTNDTTFAEGQVIDLQGLSLTNNGEGAGAFTWKLNSVTVGNTRTITTPLTAIGVNTITLQVDANALSGTRSITVTVIPDYDRDGLPNAWEQQYQLNPLDASDANLDVDGDGLSNLDEYHLGTNPRSVDTDTDGYSDSTEINAGRDPLDPNSHPVATPILNVGSVSMGFTYNNYSSLPGTKSTWVTNLGGGSLNFNVTQDATWLTVSPFSGAAPQQLNVNTTIAGLTPGTYTGHITVTAPGITGSPQTITVTLNLESIPNLSYVYLPLVLR